jgi:hypothetical protein
MRCILVLWAVVLSVLFRVGFLPAMSAESTHITLPQSFFDKVIEPLGGENFELDLPEQYSRVEILAGTSLLEDLLELLPARRCDQNYSICAIRNFFEDRFSQSQLTPLWVASDIIRALFGEVTVKENNCAAYFFMMISIVLDELKNSIIKKEINNVFVKKGVYSLYEAVALEKSIINFWENVEGINEDTRKVFIATFKNAFILFPIWVLNYLKKNKVKPNLGEFVKSDTFSIQSPTAEYLDVFEFRRFIDYSRTVSSLDVRALHGIPLRISDIPTIRPYSASYYNTHVKIADLRAARISSVSSDDIKFLRRSFPNLKQIVFGSDRIKFSDGTVQEALKGLIVLRSSDELALDKPWKSFLNHVTRLSAEGCAVMAFQTAFARLFNRFLPVQPLFSLRHIGAVGGIGLVAYGINSFLYGKHTGNDF